MPNYAILRPEYATLWRTVKINNDRDLAFRSVARRLLSSMSEYKEVEELTGVPASIIAVIHLRESDCDFRTHLHNGDKLTARTVHVPAGRPPYGNPPFTWQESAVDALRYQAMSGLEWSIEQALYQLEKYNGFGYRNHGLNTPYLWAGTNHQQPGKYVADGRFDPDAMDTQLGCVGVLYHVWALDPALRLWLSDQVVPLPTPRPIPPPPIEPTTPPSETPDAETPAEGPFIVFLRALIRAFFGR